MTLAKHRLKPKYRNHRESQHDRLQQNRKPARKPVSDARQPRQARACVAEKLVRAQTLSKTARNRQRPSEIHPARRPAVCQRRHPHRSCRQQNPQRHHYPQQNPSRFRRALCAGLGLPRPAYRSDGGKAARQRHAQSAFPRIVPRICRRTGCPPEKRLHPSGRVGRLGQSLPDHGFQNRGGYRAHARRNLQIGLSLPRRETGSVLLGLRLFAGGSGSGIQRQSIACD